MDPLVLTAVLSSNPSGTAVTFTLAAAIRREGLATGRAPTRLSAVDEADHGYLGV